MHYHSIVYQYFNVFKRILMPYHNAFICLGLGGELYVFIMDFASEWIPHRSGFRIWVRNDVGVHVDIYWVPHQVDPASKCGMTDVNVYVYIY